MIFERSNSVRRGLRPAPGRSPSPSIPSALKRWSGFLTVLGWQPSFSAILAVRSPCQLKEMMRARKIQSPGAWRLPASLRIFRSSSMFWGARGVWGEGGGWIVVVGWGEGGGGVVGGGVVARVVVEGVGLGELVEGGEG